MTRYSRSVMPGRAAGEAYDTPSADRAVFGARRSARPAANDAEPDFLPVMDDDEADMLVSRSNSDRRAGGADRRQGSGRRVSEYAPLREQASARMADEGRRGPLLLIGALLIVAVFGFVVWNAYSDGVQGAEAEVEAPELSTAGAFKTPPRVVAEAPVVAEPTAAAGESEVQLAGAPSDTTGEERPAAPPPAEAAVAPAPAPSKFTAPPPAPLKAPVQAAPASTAQTPTVQAKVQPPAPKPATTAAAAPAPAPVTPAPAGAYKPGFTAYGDHVVQIAATGTEASAEAEWTKLKGQHADLLSSAERFIQQADVNGRTVYRLRVGSFASKADAAAFCTAFKARGGNCYPAVK